MSLSSSNENPLTPTSIQQLIIVTDNIINIHSAGTTTPNVYFAAIGKYTESTLHDLIWENTTKPLP